MIETGFCRVQNWFFRWISWEWLDSCRPCGYSFGVLVAFSLIICQEGNFVKFYRFNRSIINSHAVSVCISVEAHMGTIVIYIVITLCIRTIYLIVWLPILVMFQKWHCKESSFLHAANGGAVNVCLLERVVKTMWNCHSNEVPESSHEEARNNYSESKVHFGAYMVIKIN